MSKRDVYRAYGIFTVNASKGGAGVPDTYLDEGGMTGIIFMFHIDPSSVQFKNVHDRVFADVEVVRYDPDDENGPTLWVRGVPRADVLYVHYEVESWEQRFRRTHATS